MLIANKADQHSAPTPTTTAPGASTPATPPSCTRQSPPARPLPASPPAPADPATRPAPAPTPRSERRSPQRANRTAAANRAPSLPAPQAAQRPVDTPPPTTVPRRLPRPPFADQPGTRPATAREWRRTRSRDNDPAAGVVAAHPPASATSANANNPSHPTRPRDSTGTTSGRRRGPPRPQHGRLRRSTRRPPMASRGPLVSPRQGFGEGASINRITTILSPPRPQHRHASPPSVSLNRRAVTIQRVAQHSLSEETSRSAKRERATAPASAAGRRHHPARSSRETARSTHPPSLCRIPTSQSERARARTHPPALFRPRPVLRPPGSTRAAVRSPTAAPADALLRSRARNHDPGHEQHHPKNVEEERDVFHRCEPGENELRRTLLT